MPPDLSEDVEAHSQRVGELIAGKYRIESEIGSGGMGVVYKAYREDLHSFVALKLLRTAFGFDPQTTARFLQEARTAAVLKSPHVARVQDFGTLELGPERGAKPYIVMEYLTGQDLGEVLQQAVADSRELSVTEVVDYVIQACHAIAEAHSHGIVHRDLKPANLFRTEEHDIKVLDFGIAKPGYAPTSRLTRAGLSLGSPHYMSPEQIDSPKNVDPRADIYSFGICLYELLSGTVPYNGETFGELVPRIVHGSARSLQELRPSLPPGLTEVVHRAFARAPQDRFQKVEELVGALAPYAPARSRRLIELLAPLQAPTPMDFVHAVSVLPPVQATTEPRIIEPKVTVAIGPANASKARPRRLLVMGLLLLSFLLLFLGKQWLTTTALPERTRMASAPLARALLPALTAPAANVAAASTNAPSVSTAISISPSPSSTPSAREPKAQPARAAAAAPIVRPVVQSPAAHAPAPKKPNAAAQPAQSLPALNLDSRGRQ